MLNILGIQIVGICFAVVFLYLTYINKKREELNSAESIFWMVLWVCLLIISIYPTMLNFIVKDVLNVSRTLDFFIITAFLMMFGIIYYIFINTKRTVNKVEKLVRNLALKKNKENDIKKELI
jgi:hypothetical protein